MCSLALESLNRLPPAFERLCGRSALQSVPTAHTNYVNATALFMAGDRAALPSRTTGAKQAAAIATGIERLVAYCTRVRRVEPVGLVTSDGWDVSEPYWIRPFFSA